MATGCVSPTVSLHRALIRAPRRSGALEPPPPGWAGEPEVCASPSAFSKAFFEPVGEQYERKLRGEYAFDEPEIKVKDEKEDSEDESEKTEADESVR